jgi:GNAT superfamily N-acetyltransferase
MTAVRDGQPGERAELEALQLRASLVWEQYREQLLARPEVAALPDHGVVRVAVDRHDRRLGFSVVLPRADGTWELDGLFVEPDEQHRGIGRVLVQDVLTRARAAGVRHVDVIAGPATGFYEKLGFVVTGDAPTLFGQAVALRRVLR